jgi:hypothetical protein
VRIQATLGFGDTATVYVERDPKTGEVHTTVTYGPSLIAQRDPTTEESFVLTGELGGGICPTPRTGPAARTGPATPKTSKPGAPQSKSPSDVTGPKATGGGTQTHGGGGGGMNYAL